MTYKQPNMSAEALQQAENYFTERRTVRQFSSRPVTDEELREIITLALKAPTCGTMQLYSVIVTRDRAMRDKLEPCHFNQPAATGASVILTICADFNRFTRWCKLSGADAGFDNFLSFTSAMLDATILAQQITTIAEMRGLGTCYLGTATFCAPKIAEVLQLPELVVPVASLAIGYPEGEPVETERIGVDGILYNEVYPTLTDEQILDIYKVKDQYPANRQFVEENGKENLAQVYTDVRYPRAMNEGLSVEFLDFLKKQNFL